MSAAAVRRKRKDMSFDEAVAVFLDKMEDALEPRENARKRVWEWRMEAGLAKRKADGVEIAPRPASLEARAKQAAVEDILRRASAFDAAQAKEIEREKRQQRARELVRAGIAPAQPGSGWRSVARCKKRSGRPRDAEAAREPNGRTQRPAASETAREIQSVVAKQRSRQAVAFAELHRLFGNIDPTSRYWGSAAGRLHIIHLDHEHATGKIDTTVGITADQVEAAEGFARAARNGLVAIEAPVFKPADITRQAPMRDPTEQPSETQYRDLSSLLDDMAMSQAQRMEKKFAGWEITWDKLRESIKRDAAGDGLDGRLVLAALHMLCVLDVDLTRPETIDRARKGLGYCWDFFERMRPKKYRDAKPRILSRNYS